MGRAGRKYQEQLWIAKIASRRQGLQGLTWPELAQRGHVPLHQGSILEALALAPLFNCPQEAGFRKSITAGVLKGAFSQLLWSFARVYGMSRV